MICATADQPRKQSTAVAHENYFLNINKNTIMTKIWKDENGMQIPANRITASEKLREKAADKLLAKAQKLSNQLQAFKDEFSQHSEAVYKAVMYENNVNTDERKGNFTFLQFRQKHKS